MLLAVATQEITVHGITVPIRRDTGDQRRGRLITTEHQMWIRDRRLVGLFTERPQTALLPVGTKHRQVLCSHTIYHSYHRQTRGCGQGGYKQAEYQRII